jgi:two-component system chemotaxis response regulator CheB
MAGRDPERVVVIGGSAGSQEPLFSIVQALPADVPAAICVALHLPPYFDSHLSHSIARAGVLPSAFAVQGAPLEPGRIYVAPPDHHLLIEDSALRLTRGPKENRVRPAVDPLFRSAALAYGPRVIGVVLSGALDDGTIGLWTVKDFGGVAVVQDPDDASVSGMPSSALANVAADFVAPGRALGELLVDLLRQPAPPPPARLQSDLGDLDREIAIASMDDGAHTGEARYGAPSRFACPDCGGVLWRTSRTGPLAFRCEVGHGYGSASLAEKQTEAVEDALWASLRALEDKAALARLRADNARTRGLPPVEVSRLVVQAEAADQHAAVVRGLLGSNGRSGMRSSAKD